MPPEPRDADLLLLRHVAEHRVLEFSQLAFLAHRNLKATGRRLNELLAMGLVHLDDRGYGSGRGRPSKLVSLSETAVNQLKRRGILAKDVPGEKVLAGKLSNVEHQLLVNWSRLHLVQLERTLPNLTVKFLAPTSPFLGSVGDGRPLVHEMAPRVDTPSDQHLFIPDGIFLVTESAEEKRPGLLFYLEVDLDTEALASRTRAANDIREKVLAYQAYFRNEGFKRYEQVWGCPLNGFRLLFLANAPSRKTALCRLVRDMMPSDFIWIADQTEMLNRGLTAAIWARGGRDTEPTQSILGPSLARDTPINP